MTNSGTDITHGHPIQLRPPQQVDPPGCSTCTAINEEPAVRNETGALLRICPVCGRAWPLFATGELGTMARSACDRVNRRLHLSSPRGPGEVSQIGDIHQ